MTCKRFAKSAKPMSQTCILDYLLDVCSPSGLQNSTKTGEIMEHDLSAFWVFPNLLLYFLGALGDYIIPKWLIKVPGHIAILFG